jgi:hypothetical protein
VFLWGCSVTIMMTTMTTTATTTAEYTQKNEFVVRSYILCVCFSVLFSLGCRILVGLLSHTQHNTAFTRTCTSSRCLYVPFTVHVPYQRRRYTGTIFVGQY